ncbi:hypothetical protein PGTUg99_014737 [Puccinia graminis f. sp. tritici]|uniref:Uncharacterized protein n=1 Tax=Puccinia graminis f. sp. tritici TaxID=56615 RepID=A0A5B0SA23_PUCGR|nr:hypothetical protein PGTUg99_014737 [Puccinia graminis f. sp. tritici]
MRVCLSWAEIRVLCVLGSAGTSNVGAVVGVAGACGMKEDEAKTYPEITNALGESEILRRLVN